MPIDAGKLKGIRERDSHDYVWVTEHERDAFRDRRDLLELVGRMGRGFVKLEWDGWDGKDYCYVCEATKEDGHKPNCWLATLLRETE